MRSSNALTLVEATPAHRVAGCSLVPAQNTVYHVKIDGGGAAYTEYITLICYRQYMGMQIMVSFDVDPVTYCGSHALSMF